MFELSNSDRPIDGRAASAFLTGLGFQTAEATLTKLRCVGGGPTFLRFGRRVYYRPSALNAWASQRTRELRHTSEAA
jgi:hypothetical protein